MLKSESPVEDNCRKLDNSESKQSINNVLVESTIVDVIHGMNLVIQNWGVRL